MTTSQNTTMIMEGKQNTVDLFAEMLRVNRFRVNFLEINAPSMMAISKVKSDNSAKSIPGSIEVSLETRSSILLTRPAGFLNFENVLEQRPKKA